MTQGRVTQLAELQSPLLGYGSYGRDEVSIVVVTSQEMRVVDTQSHKRQQVERVQDKGH